ncbi:MAG TPA: Flp pilus assembly protein CpaB [Armatimonadota bacterium]|nr:Flp pilus assembly protein CpaB [Armatimonadota bacterium]HOM81538.1 Flp pilus assembly protein CpaB [Armatimonadota bacterium]HOQ28665.1 Flp pilus assembly protein CpaB [Armatimonadota bacterium]HPO71980.1 Flp pilus assembly protein CpaB [Armatimonadota bacterium]HPT98179.1 Flp pilus assembly protein CpaB [Armatimonadota bacterium]
MTKRQGLLLALVLACGSTLLTYLWYQGKAPAAEAARPGAEARKETSSAVAIQPASERTTAGGFAVPRHQRAVVITVDATQGAGALAQPSDHVDILLAAKDLQSHYLAETILQDVPVLGPTGTETNATAAPATRDGKRQIVVAVSPHDAQRLMAAQLRGDLVITLRNPGDREYAYVRPVVNPAAPKPAPAPAPAAAAPAKPATPPAANPAPARRTAPRPARPAPRRPSMAVAGIPPEPVQVLPPPTRPVAPLAPVSRPAPAAPSASGSRSADSPAPKAIEVVKGTSVQTVLVKE